MTDESYKELTVDEVLEAIRNEEISVEQALDYELSGKKRKTLLDALNEGLGIPANDSTKQKTQLQVVIFNQNVKFGKNRYKPGEKVEVTNEEYNELLEAGVLQVSE